MPTKKAENHDRTSPEDLMKEPLSALSSSLYVKHITSTDRTSIDKMRLEYYTLL
jgi:hypothetical protein